MLVVYNNKNVPLSHELFNGLTSYLYRRALLLLDLQSDWPRGFRPLSYEQLNGFSLYLGHSFILAFPVIQAYVIFSYKP